MFSLIKKIKNIQSSNIISNLQKFTFTKQMEIENIKLNKFRQVLKQNNLQGYIIPHNDAHDSEYIAEADERLAYISDFTGSAGFAYVSLEEAFLWTDSRYYIQAQKQLKNGWEMKNMERGFQPWNKFVEEKYGKGYTVGYDSLLMNANSIESIQKSFSEKQIEFIAVEQNLVDSIWENKPSEPTSKVFEHELQWHNYSFNDKLKQIRNKMENKNSDLYISSRLDGIAWCLNLRGADITFNPVFKSYLLLKINENNKSFEGNGILYIDSIKITEKVQQYLNSIQITVKPYDQVFSDLQQFSANGNKVSFQKAEINRRLFESIKEQSQVQLPAPSPINVLKAIKGETEKQGFINCHIRDGSALVSYLAWLENELVNKNNTTLTEFTGAEVLESKRRALEHNVGLSFDTISSIGGNGAIVHYKPEKDTAAQLNPDLMYLLDSGGQYYDGTTDVTRTMHFKQPTQEQRDSYTRVLLGNLDLQMAIWPKKNQITGSDLDVLARRHLWSKKLDYGHGTGHGVGHFLNVHEGPQGISKRQTTVILEAGMTVTDEPGYYKTDEYGIRIEDELIIEDKGDEFLGFYNLTQCPYDQNLIDVSLLGEQHIEFINKYHQKVKQNLTPLLQKNNDQIAINWLNRHTTSIKK